MGLYWSKGIGGGFRIGGRLGGGRKRKDDAGCLEIFFGLLVLGLIFTYWKIAVALVVLYIVWIFVASYFEANSKHKALVKEYLAEALILEVEVEDAKTMPSRLKRCEKALDALQEANNLDPEDVVTGQVHATMTRLEARKETLQLVPLLDRFEKNLFKGSNKLALNALLDAMYHIQKEGVTDLALDVAQVSSPSLGDPVSIHDIEEKAREMGWEA